MSAPRIPITGPAVAAADVRMRPSAATGPTATVAMAPSRTSLNKETAESVETAARSRAATADSTSGTGAARRPASSHISAISTKPPPSPPRSVGMAVAIGRKSAKLAQRDSSQPMGSALRTSSIGQFLSKNILNDCRSAS